MVVAHVNACESSTRWYLKLTVERNSAPGYPEL